MSTTTMMTAKGQYESLVQITVTIFHDGHLFATAEDEHLNKSQFTRAVRKEYPDFDITNCYRDSGFWCAGGNKIC